MEIKNNLSLAKDEVFIKGKKDLILTFLINLSTDYKNQILNTINGGTSSDITVNFICTSVTKEDIQILLNQDTSYTFNISK